MDQTDQTSFVRHWFINQRVWWMFKCISVRKVLVSWCSEWVQVLNRLKQHVSFIENHPSIHRFPFFASYRNTPRMVPPIVPLAKESTCLMFKSPTWDGQIRSKFPIFRAFHKVNLQCLMIEIHEIPNGNGKIPWEIFHFGTISHEIPDRSSSDRSFSSALPLAAILCAFTAAAPAAATACEPGRLPPGRATWDQDMDRLGMGLCHVWV